MMDTTTVRPETIGQVLIADPDRSFPRMYKDALGTAGFELVTATTGLECVAQMRERAPDLLVLEPQLLWGGGDGVLDLMHELPELASVPVLVHTSSPKPNVVNRIRECSISGYYPKPIPPEHLTAKLRYLSGHSRQGLILAEKARCLESAISHRTHGGVYDISVEFVLGRVIVHGRSNSYYSRQLALVALREESEATEVQIGKIELDIEVKWPSCGSLYLR